MQSPSSTKEFRRKNLTGLLPCSAPTPDPSTWEARAMSAAAQPKLYLALAELLEADGTDRGGAAAAGGVPAQGWPCPGLVAACSQLPDGLQGLLLHRVLWR